MAVKRVLVQAGHLAPREPGFESGTGTAGEQELARQIRDYLVALLKADGRFKAIPMPGHITPRGIEIDAALFLHGDGSTDPFASGFCFGYPDFATNKKLAKMIRDEIEKIPGRPPHRRDNYTRALAGYYGFSRVDTSGPEVVIEHGFLTNPKERAWLFDHVSHLAKAEYAALLRYFGFESAKPVKQGYQTPPWFAEWALWWLHGQKKGKRPAMAPSRIPKSAFRKLDQIVRAAKEAG